MKKIIFIFAFSALAACSSGGGGGEETVQPLNDDQKKTLRSTGQEITDVSLATREYTDLSFNIRNDGLRLGISQKGEQYKTELAVAEQSGKCEVVKSGFPKAGEPIEELDVEIEVVDSDTGVCPFASNMVMELENDETNSNKIITKTTKLQSEAEFEVMESASLYLAMDMTKYTSKYSAMQSSVTSGTNVVESATAQGSGTFQSKSQGAIAFQVRGKSNGTYSANSVDVKSELTTIFRLKDFTAVGVIRGTQTDVDKKMDYRYFLNGEEVKEREYRKYFGERIGNITVDIQ